MGNVARLLSTATRAFATGAMMEQQGQLLATNSREAYGAIKAPINVKMIALGNGATFDGGKRGLHNKMRSGSFCGAPEVDHKSK